MAFWSLLSPGLGSIKQDRTLKAFIMIIWGIVVNINAKINLSIVYSFTGQFELAKKVIDTRWLLLYLAVYIYSVWDGFRGTVDINKLYLLADQEDAPLHPFTIKTLDINYLDKRNPWVGAAWSALMPGLGYLYLHKVLTGIFMVVWSIVVIYFSHFLQAVHFTLVGDFDQAKAILDMQWFLFLPSTYSFVIYDCYVTAVEYNKLFEKEQSKYLRDQYQAANFKMPL